MDVDDALVTEICEKLRMVVTKEVVSSALHYYGNIGTELLTYGVAYEVGAGKLPILRQASAVVKNRDLRELTNEVEELKRLLDRTIDRLAELKRTGEAKPCSSCACNDENITELDETFVGDLTMQLEQKYLDG
jgi:hypothetical protein